jgi:hypothetical protein
VSLPRVMKTRWFAACGRGAGPGASWPMSFRSSWSGARRSRPGTCCAESSDGPRQAIPYRPASEQTEEDGRTLYRNTRRVSLWVPEIVSSTPELGIAALGWSRGTAARGQLRLRHDRLP